MKSIMWKSTFREIKQSFGRFFAIMAIVALGVSLFSGLKVTRPSMVKTMGDYWKETEFYDYRLLSTVGFETQDVDRLRARKDVRGAEGAVSFDILLSLPGGNEMALKAHSLTQEVNQVQLVAGRMPQAADECVVDGLLFSEDHIGQKLTLSHTNKEEDLEKFAAEEYTIVGIVRSPLYVHYDRGNTSLGNGRISGFMFVPEEGFAVEYYTEIYVALEQDHDLYGHEYDAYLEEKEAEWEVVSASLSKDRFNRILAEANGELSDAEAELEEGRAEGEAELSDARQKLEDAKRELADGEKKLADARKELADGRDTLKQKEAELSDARIKLSEEEKKLADGEAQIVENRKLLQEQKDSLEAGRQQLWDAQTALDAQWLSLVDQEGQIKEALAEVAGTKQEIAGREQKLDEEEALLRAMLGQVTQESQKQLIEQQLYEISVYREQLQATKVQAEAGEFQMSAMKAAIAGAKEELSKYQDEINAALNELAFGEQQLAQAEKQLEEAERQLHEGKAALSDACAQLTDGQKQLEEGREELKQAEAEIVDGERELADGRKEYEDGLSEYEKGLSEFEEEIADAEEKLADARMEIAKLEEPDSYLLGRDTNVGYVCFESDSGIVDGIADVFPVFFFAVAALVCITTMNRMVEEQRTQIGVLKALGYSRWSVMCKYLFYSGAAAALGCLIGFAAGTWFFPKVIWYGYGILYDAGALAYVFDGKLAAISLIVSMLCSMGATWFSCRYELSAVAAQLMRPKAPKSGHRVFLERVPFIWNRLKFLHKVSFRNVFRYKKRFFMMIIGISGCTALLVTGFGLRDSVSDVAADQYGRIQLFDLTATGKDTLKKEDQEEIAGVLEGRVLGYAVVMEASVELVTEEKSKALYLVAADKDQDMSPYLGLYTDDGKTLEYPGLGECILQEQFAQQFGIGVGDTITLRDEDMRTMELKVSGLNVNYISSYVYISTQTYEQLMQEEAPCKTIYVNMREGEDSHRLLADLMKLDQVVSVTVNEDMLDRFDSMLGSIDLIVLVIIGCAAGLAFIVLYNLTNINITERVREIATIKVLGFYRKETSAYVFRENLVLTFLGGILGLLLGRYFHRFVMSAVKVDMVCFDVQINPQSYFYSILLTMVFAWFVSRFMNKKLDKISMTESLKSVD